MVSGALSVSELLLSYILDVRENDDGTGSSDASWKIKSCSVEFFYLEDHMRSVLFLESCVSVTCA